MEENDCILSNVQDKTKLGFQFLIDDDDTDRVHLTPSAASAVASGGLKCWIMVQETEVWCIIASSVNKVMK